MSIFNWGHKKSVELKPIRIISLILPRNENKIITRENKTAEKQGI